MAILKGCICLLKINFCSFRRSPCIWPTICGGPTEHHLTGQIPSLFGGGAPDSGEDRRQKPDSILSEFPAAYTHTHTHTHTHTQRPFFFFFFFLVVSSWSLECPVHAFHLLLNFVADRLRVTCVVLLTVLLNVALFQLQLQMLAYCLTLKLEVALNLGIMSFNSSLVTSCTFSVLVGKTVTYPEKVQTSTSLQQGAVL